MMDAQFLTDLLCGQRQAEEGQRTRIGTPGHLDDNRKGQPVEPTRAHIHLAACPSPDPGPLR